MSGAFANLPPTDGARKGGATQNSAGLGSYQVRKAEGTARPNYGAAQIAAADRRNETDPALRARDDWI